MRTIPVLLLAILISFTSTTFSKEKEEKKKDPMASSVFSGLKFRSIGPGIASGRIIDFAVCPDENNYYFVAVASGGVWKTTNSGITFKPVFDSQGSYSIGCVTMDPNNKYVIWVGTGENNSQRSVSYGDGVYKSVDGGKSWKNVGLKQSEHIGKILVDPRNSEVVYVAAQGPLWGPGGDRGLYKTIDGGKNWEKVLDISENTGVSDIHFDPRNPDVIYASSYQRRRHVWTLINGGPESAVHKTTDGGKSWNKLTNGLPSGNVGRIGLAVSPVNPDIVFALVEADDRGGLFRSTDRGASWEKRNPYKSTSAQYYQEIFCDPENPDKLYSVDTYTKYSLDGGKTFNRLGLKERHVDDHALWIDPKDTDHLLIGGDGGVYETWNMGHEWRYFENLPVTQFYRIGIDNTKPFYYVYGGTQDNATIGGPSRTVNQFGIINQDFYFTKGGDGFQTRVDPENPDIVYSQAQYGSLVRFDRKSGERTDIQPMEEKGEELRWNWDSPLIISPHSPTRLYFAANKLFRSDDRGNSWKKISGDLSRQIDRNTLEVMGKVWGPEAIAKNASTSLYGNIVSLAESPVKEDLVYVGTDDGLIQVTEDAGVNWTKIDKFPGLPKLIYVSDILASQHNEGTVYACFDNHKSADFKPYIFKSLDKGKTWKSIASNLPENGPVHSIVEDHVNPDLLFAGTEFGIFFTIDGGMKWVQLKGGIPTIAIFDIEIQKRENDLALASFGRGFYIMDNYAPLRELNKEVIDGEAHLFSVKDALMYVPNNSKARHSLGHNFYRAKNPEFGAVFTYYLKESIKTKKAKRMEEEKKLRKDGKTPPYPTFAELRAEDEEEKPILIFEVKDSRGNTLRRMTAPASAGMHRINWDLTIADTYPINAKSFKLNKYSGMPVLPGKYNVTMYKRVEGKTTKLSGPVEFNCKVLNNTTLPARDREVLALFHSNLQELQRAVLGANKYVSDLSDKLSVIKKTLMGDPNSTDDMMVSVNGMITEMKEIKRMFSGDASISNRNANQTPSILSRAYRMFYYTWRTTSEPTETNLANMRIVRADLEEAIEKLKSISRVKLPALEAKMDQAGSPWTPGRLPTIK